MIYTKMMDSLNEEETPQEDQVVPQEQPAEIEEISVDDIESLNAYDKEHVELSAEITLKSMEFDKKFSMMSHVAKFGVDRSFLSICNSNGELATELGITLPATEDFEIYGDPNSNVSKKVISSMESFLGFGKKESLWSKFWKWIKEIVGKILGWIKGFFTKVWEFIKKLLGLGKAKLDKIEEVATQLKKAGIKTVDVNEDFARLGQDLQRGFIERQDRLIKSRQRVATIKEIANTSLKIIKDLVKTRGEWAPARVKELEATTGKLKDWVSNTWGAVKGVTGAVTDTIGNTWDFLHDISHSNENNARRYAQKTVVAQRRREYVNASRRSNDPLDDWMAHTYDIQGGSGKHTKDTIFDNSDPWSYNHYGSSAGAGSPSGSGSSSPWPNWGSSSAASSSGASSSSGAASSSGAGSPPPGWGSSGAAGSTSRTGIGSLSAGSTSRSAIGSSGAASLPAQTSPVSIEELIRNHLADIRRSIERDADENAVCQGLVEMCEGIIETLRSLQNQVPNSTDSEHAAVVQTNIQTLLNALTAILADLRSYSGGSGADLVRANRAAETQLASLIYGFQDQIGALGVAIFDSVNGIMNDFTATDVTIRDVNYRRFNSNPIAGSTGPVPRINGVWVRPERTTHTGGPGIWVPDTWGVYIPAGNTGDTNQLSVELTCSLPRQSIADMMRKDRAHQGAGAGGWGATGQTVTINVRFCIPLNDGGFATAIDNAYARGLTNMTYDFTSMVNPGHVHNLNIRGDVLRALYTVIQRTVRSHSALAPFYPHLNS